MRYTHLFVLALLTAGAAGQESPPLQPMRIAADFARFRGDGAKVFVEVYYAIPQQSLTYRRDSTGWRAGADVTIVLTGPDGSLHADRWMVPHVRSDSAEGVRGMDLVGLYPLMLEQGDHRVRLIAHDAAAPARVDSVEFPVTVRLPDSTAVTLSDIELAASIRKSEGGGQFTKNTLEVVPNVERVVGEGRQGWVYAEAYGLLAAGDSSDYTLRTIVLDPLGKEVISRERVKKRIGESAVLVDQLGANSLRTGTYTLVMALLDGNRKTLSSSGKKFFVYNPALGVDSSLLIDDARVTLTEFARMEEPELDREFAWLRYVVTDDEKSRYEALRGAEAKRKFLVDFWSRRPSGTRKEILDRVAHTNASFKVLGKEGYLTERGRVYIMYGPPDDVDRHASGAETRPIEIWHYPALQSGVIFVFVLRQMGGDYDLVHSTHRNELHDENWERFAIQR